MPAAAEAPASTTAPPTTAPVSDTGISRGAPSTGAKPSTFRPPNPAFERAAKGIQARADKAAGIKPPKAEPKTKTDAEIPPTVTAPETEAEPPAAEASETPAGTETKPGEETTESGTKGDKKVSPWRLVDQWKKTAAELKAKAENYEQELTKLKSGTPPEAQSKEVTERLAKAEAQLKEYQDELRFTRYEKHPEFIEKYQKPYEAAWGRATSELSEVSVTDPATGEVRSAKAEDMLALVNLPLGKAREYADQLFGVFADDAMAHRKEIKSLFDTQQAALKDARENGSKRDQERQAKFKAEQEGLAKTISEVWQSANREAATDSKVGHFFTPVEGDQEGNTALAKGFELVDKAFSEDPRDPGITPEERASRIRRHVAMRNRAAAFGRLRRWHERDQATISELKKELEDYKKSEPSSSGGSNGGAPASAPADPFARIAASIRKRAH